MTPIENQIYIGNNNVKAFVEVKETLYYKIWHVVKRFLSVISDSIIKVITFIPRNVLWLCSEGKLRLEEEYRQLLSFEKEIDEKHFIVAKQHPFRNRYDDVLPNEPTRVILSKDSKFYFNANWVLGKKAIACQGPLPTEINEFWKMVWDSNINTLVMLVSPIENGRNKCSEYWKHEQSFSESIIFEKDGIKIVERKIKISKDSEEREVIQYHLQGWPDFGVISPEVLSELVTLVDKREGKFLAHCSAGLGRTGAFLAAYEAYKQKTDKIFSIARDLRDPEKGRVGLIQTPEQYCLASETAKMLLMQKQTKT